MIVLANVTDLWEIIKRIDENKILLPDFQRKFVWRDVEQQRQIVASVLARMPIGSILLLKSSNPGEFSSKALGRKDKVDTAKIKGDVDFLLDGQQRMTVLTNVFSNVLFKNIKNVSELTSPTLKRRFFILLPKWSIDSDDNFGFQKLSFPTDNLGDTPDYLSGDLLEYIVCLDFKAKGNEPYNPFGDTDELSDYCAKYSDGYLVPLYLVATSEGKENRLVRYIAKQIKCDYCEDVISYYGALLDTKSRLEFCKNLGINKIMDEDQLEEEIQSRFDDWWDDFRDYIKVCVSKVNLDIIKIGESQRGRAIDIYENLNRGGVSLNTFDLIMAKVAKVNKENFYDRLISYISRTTDYDVQVVPKVIAKSLKSIKDYSASSMLGCFDDKKEEISSKYVDAFLNVLSLCCYNKDFSAENIKIDYIKRNKILDIPADDINDNAENVCVALDRACFFLNVRCGIRKLTEVNNLFIFVLIAYVFYQDKYYNDEKIHDLLEGWYWSVLFCGEFDKDQNKNFIKQLILLIKLIEHKGDNNWLLSMKELILDTLNYSDKDLVLYKKTDDERYPKKNIRDYICQFYLAQTYNSLFDNNKKINVFCREPLEAHHILPLGSVSKLGQTTALLRKNTKHICNSPMNFIYITKSENNDISDRKINDYIQYITDEAKSALNLKKIKDDNYSDNDILEFLEQRFDAAKGDIKKHVDMLISES